MIYTRQPQRLHTFAHARTKEAGLLTRVQYENLVSSHGEKEFRDRLYDTFLAAHLADADGDVVRALELALEAARSEVYRINGDTPVARYAFLSIEATNWARAAREYHAGTPRNDLEAELSGAGVHRPEQLVEFFYDEVAPPEAGMRELVRKLKDLESARDIDEYVDRWYFTELLSRAAESDEPFLREMTRVRIDMFNALVMVRSIALRGEADTKRCVPGGSLSVEGITTREEALLFLARGTDSTWWQEAASDYRENGNMSLIEAACELARRRHAQRRDWAPEESVALVSWIESLIRQSNQIRTLYAAKKHNYEEAELAYMLGGIYARA